MISEDLQDMVNVYSILLLVILKGAVRIYAFVHLFRKDTQEMDHSGYF